MIKVTDKLYRGPRPPSLQWLKEQGFGAVIDLQSGAYEAVTEDQYEQEKKDPKNGMVVIDFNLSNFSPPSKDTVMEIIGIIESMEAAIGVKTYIHCLRGKDRTGFICASFRMFRNGFAYKTAIAEMDRLGFNNLFYWWWKFYLRKYANG